MKRTSLGIALLALAATFVTGPVRAGADPSKWCSDGAPVPCVVSATLNGTDITSSDPDWEVYVDLWTGGGPTPTTHDVGWAVRSKTNADPYLLGSGALDDQWIISLDVGSSIPRMAWTHGTNFTADRIDDGDGTYHVTITDTPIVLAGDCDQSVWPWTCSKTATTERDGYLDGGITDYGIWDDAAQRSSFYGMNFASNVSATSLPPEMDVDPATGLNRLLIRLANPHFLMDGSTVFLGSLHLVIPKTFLQTVYGIDDPSTLTSAAIEPGLSGTGGGTVTVTLDPDGNIVVDGHDITFSHRMLTLNRGVITPTKPTSVVAKRATRTGGELSFAGSKSRGSRITGYQGKCVAPNLPTRYGTAKASPVAVSNLVAGKAYDCRVHARSRAGFGAWSAPAHLRGR